MVDDETDAKLYKKPNFTKLLQKIRQNRSKRQLIESKLL